MVVINCPLHGCPYVTPDEDPTVVSALLNIHALSHATPTPMAMGPKLNRPQIDTGIDLETWNAFIRRWEAFKIGSNINAATASTQLFQCASEGLGDLLLKTDPDLTSRPEAEVKAAMEKLAVIPTAKGVLRADLMQLTQGTDESFRTFAARVKGKAETCGFAKTVKCMCGTTVTADYTEEVVRDVLLAGIVDVDIRREALSAKDIQSSPLNEIIALVESREMARNATPHSSFSAMSTFKRNKAPRYANIHNSQPAVPEDKTSMSPCPECGKGFRPFTERRGMWNSKPHKMCLDCWRAKRRRPQHPQGTSTELNTLSASHGEISQLSTISLQREIFSKSEWKRAKFSEHPRVTFKLGILGRSALPNVTIQGIADTGAQSNLWGLQDFIKAGFSQSELKPVQLDVRAANRNPIKIIGAFQGQFHGESPQGQTVSCNAMVYVSDAVSGFYLSYDTMVDLLIIDNNFPTIGGAQSSPSLASEHLCTDATCHVRSLNSGCPKMEKGSCGCPLRSAVPDRPTCLPFLPTSGNNDKMKDWLLNRYCSSTFNTCPHRPLPCMTGPPIEIHVDPAATPRTCHTAASIPMHWQDRVHDDLIRDESLGVIEKVPYGEPVTWCHRMVVTRKHDGTPRRTVDLSPLNKFCKRETFASEAPFHLARRIPGDTWKTVTDAWNGFHSVPLREGDRHLTTFITPFGRWRYIRAPQGFLSSGDGYNRRFDAILSDFTRKERCVDDTVFYDTDLETHWWRTIDFLTLVGRAGIVLNPDKFQFAQREVDFAGFRVLEKAIQPLPKYLDAIKSFPTPKSTTDIRSWFGLVNQVANYAQLRDALARFRPFLSPRHKFFWTPDLDEAFNKSKQAIIDAICHGVEIFDPTKPTCLRPDWSIRGIGYFLLQQHCTCSNGMPDCCQNGWKITLAGSRFLSGAEQRYAPIEGEALAIAWGLEQTRYFTQGCSDLLVVTDHKPLTKIFGDRTLDEISNTRLFRLKQRTLPWTFRIAHAPGRTNAAADATSRHPSPGVQDCSMSFEDCSESLFITSLSQAAEEVTSIPWTLIAHETSSDPVLSQLLISIEEGFINIRPGITDFMRYKDFLYCCDGVILYNDRVVIPASLRHRILEGLHSAHQGVSSMELRAQSIVFWPGMTKDIHNIRAKCPTCNRNAPSQAPTPSEPAEPPSTPFEQVFADFFDFGGYHYLVIGDRLSGWSEIFATPSGTSYAGARGLIACLRSFFATFGVPQELSSDGGPEFTASTTREFLQRWGVRHRISSAYFPQSNGRAEVAVKSAKRLLRSNVGPTGTLDNDKLLRALLQLRNTPDPDCNVSPAQIIYGRPIRDAFSFANRLEKYQNPEVHPIWRDAWASKEAALRTRFTRTSESLNEHAKALQPLKPGDKCFVQNQTGIAAKRWDRTGTVTEALGHDQYTIKIDGSGRVTKRNRRFLRAFTPATSTMRCDPLVAPPLSAERHVPSLVAVPNNSIPNPWTAAVPVPLPSPTDPTDGLADRVFEPEPELSPVTPSVPSGPEDRNTNREKVPRALARLLPFNKPGLKEAE